MALGAWLFLFQNFGGPPPPLTIEPCPKLYDSVTAIALTDTVSPALAFADTVSPAPALFDRADPVDPLLDLVSPLQLTDSVSC